MGRSHRVLYAGAHYHVTTRGNRREVVFVDDSDRRQFLALLARTCITHDWRCLGYCLMTNHYHLVIRTDRPTLSRGMHFLNSSYAREFNTHHQKTGHVFESRCFTKVIEHERYLSTVIRYVVFNPVRANLCTRPEDFRWSSHHAVVGRREHGPWFDLPTVHALFGPDKRSAIENYGHFVAEVANPDPPWDVSRLSRRERADAIMRVHRAGLTVAAIATKLGIGVAIVRRVLRAAADASPT
jgi:REP element-mobilizing transposase RayT